MPLNPMALTSEFPGLEQPKVESKRSVGSVLGMEKMVLSRACGHDRAEHWPRVGDEDQGNPCQNLATVSPF